MAAVTKDELAIGTKVTIKVKEQEMLGFIRFQGTTDFSEGDWVGIELEEPRGKNDGSVAEKRYFTCKPEHGLFVRPFHVLRIEDTKQENGQRNLRLELAEAVEENDDVAIERLLPEAEKKGVIEQELDLARSRLKSIRRSPIEVREPEAEDTSEQGGQAAGENYKDTLKWLLHEAKKKGLAEKELEMARSLLQSIERPKELQEPENEDTPLIDLLGGQDEIKKCRLMSQKIGQQVQDMVREGEAAAQQPYIYQGMGLEHMLELATGFKKTFDSLCHKLAEKVQGKEEFGGWKVSYMDAPIKSKASAESKVNTEYHGDCRQLKDVVRGTLVIDGNVDTTSIETVYKLLEQLVKSEELLRDANARFTRFSDRYQNPVGPSQYRDFLFLLKIGDFLCELQVNFKKAIDVKQNKQHKVYEKERMGTRKLLEAAMNKDENMVRILLSTDIDKGHLVSTRDCHGFTPLHYAARHGAIGILENLIDAGADVMAVDQEGLSPLYHSVMMQHLEASRKLLEQMSKRPKQDLRTPALQKTMQSIWGAIHFSERLRGLKENACELAKRAFTTPARHVFGLAASGDVLAMKAARETLDEEYLGLGWFQTTTDVATGMRMLMLDWAIASGSAAMATLVRELGNSVSRFGDDLSMYSKKEEVQSLVSRGQMGRFRAYHAVRPILPQEMAEYLCLACEHQRLDMAYAIWTMASGDLKEVLNAEQKASLAELGGDAAATGHLEFVRLLIEAEVPLEHESKRNGKKMIRRAADNGQVQVIRDLAAAGASVEGSDLGAAASKGHLQAMKALIEAKADPNERYGSAASDCPAGRGAMSNQSEALQLLRSRGVNIGTKELIALAKEKQSRECLAVMEEHRAETAPKT